MKYPDGFSDEAQAAVEQEKIFASIDFLKARDHMSNPGGFAIDEQALGTLVHGYIVRVVLAFAKEACKLGRARAWSVPKIDEEVHVFMAQVVAEAQSEKAFHKCGQRPKKFYMLETYPKVNVIAPAHLHFLKQYPEWQQYQSDLLSVTKAQKSNRRPADKPLGASLKKYREAAILTQEQLAALVGITPRSVKRHESGATSIRGGNRQSYERVLSEALGKSISLE